MSTFWISWEFTKTYEHRGAVTDSFDRKIAGGQQCLRQCGFHVSRCEAEMKSISLYSKTYSIPFISLFFLSAFWSGLCFAENAMPQNADLATTDSAREVFARLEDYVKNNAIQFSTSYNTQNVSLGTSRGGAHFYIERPNLLRIELSGNGFSYLMTSDGKVFTIYDEKTKRYAQRPATERPIEAVNLFTGLAAFQARVLQFFGLVGDVARGDSDLKVTKVGVDRVGDFTCVRYDMHYSSQADSDRWTVWLREGDLPLPCKTFIRSSDEGSQQTNLFTWENKDTQSEKYVFIPPSGSTEVSISELALRPLQ